MRREMDARVLTQGTAQSLRDDECRGRDEGAWLGRECRERKAFFSSWQPKAEVRRRKLAELWTGRRQGSGITCGRRCLRSSCSSKAPSPSRRPAEGGAGEGGSTGNPGPLRCRRRRPRRHLTGPHRRHMASWSSGTASAPAAPLSSCGAAGRSSRSGRNSAPATSRLNGNPATAAA